MIKLVVTLMFLTICLDNINGQSYTRCKSVNLRILDNNLTGISDTFVVAGISPFINRLEIKIDTLLHTWVGDLRIKLTKDATTIMLTRSPGLGTNGSSGDNFIGTVFSDSARYSIDSVTFITGQGQFSPPYTGYFRTNSNGPLNPITSTPLEAFRFSNPNGVWTLNFMDSAQADTGTVKRYCFTIDHSVINGFIQNGAEIPSKYFLEQNYPNPFNPATNIKFGLPKAGNVKLVVLDILGKEVATLSDGNFNAGEYSADFDASSLSSGVYFYKLIAEDFTQTKKMLLVK